MKVQALQRPRGEATPSVTSLPKTEGAEQVLLAPARLHSIFLPGQVAFPT
jgi:hypothetical protein